MDASSRENLPARLEQLYKEYLYPSKSAFKKILKAKQVPFTEKELDAIYSKPQKKKTPEPIKHYSDENYHFILYVDLMDFQRYKRLNGNYAYILTVLEWRSRYAWAFPIKQKTPEQIAPLIKSVIEELSTQVSEAPMIRVVTDEGSEFKGAVSKMLKQFSEKGIFIFRLINVVNNKNVGSVRKSTVPVERFNKTVLLYLKNYWEQNDKANNKVIRNWVDPLPRLIDRYNSIPHSTTNEKPKDRLKAIAKKPLTINLTPIPERDPTGSIIMIKVGDMARVRMLREQFEKKTLAREWSHPMEVVKVEYPWVTIAEKATKLGRNKEVKYLINDVEREQDSSLGSLDADDTEVRTNAVQNKTRRLQSKSGFKERDEVEKIEDDGTVVFKARLQPRAAQGSRSQNSKARGAPNHASPPELAQ